MTHPTFRSLVARLVFLAAPVLLAQGGPMPPPPLMLFVREAVKPGHDAAHAATEAAWSRILAKGQSTDHYLGMTAMTGRPEALFIMGYGSYADWGAKQAELEKNPAFKREIEKAAQQDGEQLTGVHLVLGSLREDLSYGPPVEIGTMRYLRVRTMRVKQGMADAFARDMKQALAGYAKTHFPGSFALYEVEAGTGSPTFIAIRPLKSLADLDAFDGAVKALKGSASDAENAAMDKAFGACVAADDTEIYAFNPKLSFPGPNVIASDPAFWAPKPAKKAAK
jgi:hypothetical protein